MRQPPTRSTPLRTAGRFAALVLVTALALQAWFALRIAWIGVMLPSSTTLQRSEIARIATDRTVPWHWSQQVVTGDAIAPSLARAVIASEDAGFVDHDGVDWDALERARERNERARARADRLNARVLAASAAGRATPARTVTPRLVGGSTITQQLAKNLFLSGERTHLRKGQELVLALMLEGLLDKERILQTYLNSVEFGDGVFGAQAAAQHYHRVDANRLSPRQSARLAVLLPAPKRLGPRIQEREVGARAATILARMGEVETP